MDDNCRDNWISKIIGVFYCYFTAKSGDLRTKFIKCASFEGIFRAGMRHVLSCPDSGIVGEKVRESTLTAGQICN